MRSRAGLKSSPHGLTETKGSIPTRRRNVRHTGLKILIDQGIAGPINCALFLGIIQALRGGAFHDCLMNIYNVSSNLIPSSCHLSLGLGCRKSDIKQRFWTVKLAAWRFWPLISLINFSLVPVDRRILVSSVAGLCWSTFLALKV